MKEHGFQTSINPLGISYNPFSIANNLSRAHQSQRIEESELVYHQERWHHHDFHSDFSGNDRSDVLNQLNTQQQYTKNFLEKTDFLSLTLGTAWIYERNGQIVNNCHKFPSHQFNKRLMSSDEIRASLESIQAILPSEANLLITISPIRHLKDGGIENSQSKSRLIQSALDFSQNQESVSYFPSYEIMMDELRAYRFYEKDLTHPNEMQFDHIWTKSKHTYMSENTIQSNKRIYKYKK